MEKFNLQWNDFMSTVSKSFAQLRREEDFYDVTLHWSVMMRSTSQLTRWCWQHLVDSSRTS